MSHRKAHFTLLHSKDYLSDLTNRVHTANTSIYISSLIYAYDDVTRAFCDALEAAAKRGIKVTVSADYLTFRELQGRVIGPVSDTHQSSQVTRQHISRLIEYGASVYILGKSKNLNPYAGRSHVKWSIVDDTVYAFGGVNLYKLGINSSDFMFRCDNKSLATELAEQQSAIAHGKRSYSGFKSDLNPLSIYYIDSGRPGSSLIYDRALALAERASSITLVSQYCPTGPLAKLLRQKSASIYFNRPDIMKNKLESLMISFDQLRGGITNMYQLNDYIHSKYIIFTFDDGSKKAITGSHNFSYGGVRLGTKEIAIETSDKNILSLLDAFTDNVIVNTKLNMKSNSINTIENI